MTLPPPHNLDAEAVCLSAALWGDVSPSVLRLQVKHFWSGEHRSLWAVLATLEELGQWSQLARRLLHLDLVVALVLRVGEVRCPVDGELQRQADPEHVLRRCLDIMERCPRYPLRVEDYAAMVREAHRRRELIRGLQLCEAALRTGEQLPERVSRWVAQELRRARG